MFCITPWLPASGGGGSEGFAPAAGPLLVGGWLGGGWDRFDGSMDSCKLENHAAKVGIKAYGY